MPVERPACSASSAPVKSSLRLRPRTWAPIDSAMDRLAAGCGASDPVLSSPSAGLGAAAFRLGARGFRCTLALASMESPAPRRLRPAYARYSRPRLPPRALSRSVASGDSRPLVIRDPAPHDEGAWRALWAGYCAFYETSVAEAVTAGTWTRILTPGSPLFGRIAEWKGEGAGFTVSVLHQGSWTLDPICYLEDLFVAPKARGHGIGRELIADLPGPRKQRG